MTKLNYLPSLEECIYALKQVAEHKDTFSMKEILNILSGNGRSLILILLSLPFCQPIQIPGLSTPFGIVIMFIGLRMAFGKKALLPKKVLAHKVKSSTVKLMINKALWWHRKIRPLLHPRLQIMSQSSLMKFLNPLTIALLGIFLALPLPIPFSNMIAAWSICLFSFGMIENDGLVIMIGYLLALIAFGLLIFIAFESAALFAHIKTYFT